MSELAGLVVVVCGGLDGEGAGKRLAAALVGAGARVFLTGDAAEAIAATIAQLGHNAADGLATMDGMGDRDRVCLAAIRRFGRVDAWIDAEASTGT